MVAHLSLLLYLHHPITTVFFVLILLSTSYGEDDNKEYTACKKHFSCGVFSGLSYPFWGGDRPEFCGRKGFELKCEKDQFPIIASDRNIEFRLSRLNQPFRLMTLQLENPTDYICPTQTSADSSTPSDFDVFGYDRNLQNLNLLHNCTVSSPTLQQYRISNCSGSSFYASDDFLELISYQNQTQCSLIIKIPIPVASFNRLTGDRADLERVLGEKFNVSYKYDQSPSICDSCMASGGLCGTNMTDPSREFLCLCRDHPYSLVCEGTGSEIHVTGTGSSRFGGGRKIAIAISGAVAAIIAFSIIAICFTRREGSFSGIIAMTFKLKSSQKVDRLERNGRAQAQYH
ncbi:hypothetical protein DKX38_005925 [Salix brachista]|uniref:non-specific serine/threonine protein kinase n=1 Tax=Salix brachista TaxID=2182728 RepID=A0A5N5N1T4_9ROSI|nr:hypothetical protein DKX38_005925 [Salix brachista]